LRSHKVERVAIDGPLPKSLIPFNLRGLTWQRVAFRPGFDRFGVKPTPPGKGGDGVGIVAAYMSLFSAFQEIEKKLEEPCPYGRQATRLNERSELSYSSSSSALYFCLG
jgi:hypothetical protein